MCDACDQENVRPKYREILDQVFETLHLTGAPPGEISRHLPEIIDELSRINAAKTVDVAVTGRISEELCETELKVITATGGNYGTTPSRWRWIGDFFLHGAPVNTIVSVKSLTAKERLLSSGTGSLLSPTLGWGIFAKAEEFRPKRLLQYRFKSFFAIYVPDRTFNDADRASKEVLNSNARPLLRRHSDFVSDIRSAIVGGYVDPMKL